MANIPKKTDETTNLAYTGFSTDKAKDDAYMADRQKAQKVADTVKAKGLELGGTEFFEHKSRREILGENLTNYTPAKFALNMSASRRIFKD